MVKVSVIVPAYNAEVYIERCIISILNQTYYNFELIIINDGSTDSTKYICEKYAQNDNRIKLINNKNQGVSKSRNEGIKLAKGKYIQFVDSDDFIERNMIEELIYTIEKNDIDLVICEYNNYLNEKNKKNIKFNSKYINQIIDNKILKEEFDLLYRGMFIQCPWNKFYKASIIKENSIYFREDLSLGEDFIFNIKYIMKSNKSFLLSKSLYNYVNCDNSLTKKYYENYFLIQKEIHELIKLFLQSQNNQINKKFLNLKIDNLMTCINYEIEKNVNKTDIYLKIKNIIDDKYTQDIINSNYIVSIKAKIVRFLVKSKNIKGIVFAIKLKKYINKLLK